MSSAAVAGLTSMTPRKIFVNLPVSNLERSQEFFRRLGFEHNPHFTDDNAACMIVSEHAFVMLLAEPFFRTFTKKLLCDTGTHTEVLLALSCETRAEVDRLLGIALEHGGRRATEPVDHGFMYVATFHDPDGHHWELCWMSPEAVPS